MPIDTRDKRASVIGVDLPAPRMEQNPSGTIAQSGRQIAGHIYSGILAIVVIALPRVLSYLARRDTTSALLAKNDTTSALRARRDTTFTYSGAE